jgi:hypothetical protein
MLLVMYDVILYATLLHETVSNFYNVSKIIHTYLLTPWP